MESVRPYNIFVVDVHPDEIHRGLMYSKDNTCVKTSGRCITQLAKMSIDPKFIELIAGVLIIFLYGIVMLRVRQTSRYSLYVALQNHPLLQEKGLPRVTDAVIIVQWIPRFESAP